MSEIKITSYGLSLEVEAPFEDVVKRVREAFSLQGFGVLSEINVKEKMWEKLQKEMEEYLILGMCNPKLASLAIDAEPNIGLFLPCNVVVRQAGEKVIVVAQRPSFLSRIIEKEGMEEVAREAEGKIEQALVSLG